MDLGSLLLDDVGQCLWESMVRPLGRRVEEEALVRAELYYPVNHFGGECLVIGVVESVKYRSKQALEFIHEDEYDESEKLFERVAF